MASATVSTVCRPAKTVETVGPSIRTENTQLKQGAKERGVTSHRCICGYCWLSALALSLILFSSKTSLAANLSLPASYPSELRLAWQCYTNGSYSNSVTHYQAAMRAAPESLDARLGCLLPLLALARFSEAESLATRVLHQYPANYYANLRLAYALRKQGKFPQAETVLNRTLAQRPADTSLLLELALVKLARHQNATAKRLFFDVLTLAPENAIALEQLASPSLRTNPRDEPLAPARAFSAGLGPPAGAAKLWGQSAAYGAYLDYHNTAAEDHAYSAGLYTSLGYGLEHVVEAEADYLHKDYRGYPLLHQWDTTLTYANYSLPHLKLRAGGHYVTGEDAFTDQGWVVFGGAEYYAASRWAVGVDGYFTKYPNSQDPLEVAQLTPHVGVTLGRGDHHAWNNDLRGYWIHLSRDFDAQHDFFSLEDRLSLTWRRWTFAAFGWAGQQMFAVRNDGFALYNVAEKHEAGYGAEVRYALTDHWAFTLRASREQFHEFGLTASASSDLYLAMLGVRF